MSQRKKRGHFLSEVLFLDVLFDWRTRPLLIYTGIIIALGAVLYHWHEGWN